MSLPFLTVDDVSLSGKRVLVREDFNVPIVNGVIQSDLRIRAAIPGLKKILTEAKQVILMSHLGRPEAGVWQEEYSLQPVAIRLAELLQHEVSFSRDWPPDANDKLVLLENVRFKVGEVENSPALAQQMAQLCDVFVMDAFGSVHREHASTMGVAEYAPLAVAGPLLAAEVAAIDKIMLTPQRPLVAIIGGAKVSTKLAILQSLLTIVDVLLIGGGMANTLLAAQGYNVGASLYEPELRQTAREFLDKAQTTKTKVLLPVDVITQDGLNKDLQAIGTQDKILDIGKKTIELYTDNIANAVTILWNGPLGVFEEPKFANGTIAVAQDIAQSRAFSVIGGGDTLVIIDKLQIADKISYISTGGGAFLEYLEGRSLPGIKVLAKQRKNDITTN